MNEPVTNRIFEDDLVTIDQADFCTVPGYLILRLKSGAESFGDLAQAEAERLGSLLSLSIAAIERIAEADRVYCLTFAELDRRLHFHLFPRSSALLRDYHRSTGTEDEPVNGPMLFEWARAYFPAGTPVPEDYPALSAVCRQLQKALAQT